MERMLCRERSNIAYLEHLQRTLQASNKPHNLQSKTQPLMLFTTWPPDSHVSSHSQLAQSLSLHLLADAGHELANKRGKQALRRRAPRRAGTQCLRRARARCARRG